MKTFQCSADNFFSHACLTAAQMLLSGNGNIIVKSEHIASGSITAEMKDRTILRVNLAGAFDRQEDYLCPESSPSMNDDGGSAPKFFTIFVDLSPFWICALTSSSLLIHFVK